MADYYSLTNQAASTTHPSTLEIISLVLWWGVLVAVIIALFHFSRRHRRDVRHMGPMEILKERYAKGEIDRQEFEEKKKDLAS